MVKKHKGLIITVVLVAVFGAAIYYANQAGERANEGVVIEPNTKGNPDGEVVLVKYSDFQCPACAAAATVVDDVLEVYGEDVRFEYRHFPLISIHPLAIPAARAVEAAGQQGKFYEMHDLVFENQRAWSAAPNPTAIFISYAEQLELDIPTFRQHLDASVIDRHIREQFEEARNAGFTGTPTFTLNGERMNFTSYDDFAAQIASAVASVSGASVQAEATGTSTATSSEGDTPAADIGLEFSL
jgi:protein-disulfide isomerase